jgi:glutamyl-tRNA synthetase
MPLMMGKDGAKLSKRHGGVAVFEYKEEGFLPEALANYLLLLGWTPKDGKELISLTDAAKEFDIKDLNNVQVRFDIDKLRWINGEYIRTKSDEELYKLLKNRLFKPDGMKEENIDKGYVLRIIELYKARIKTLSEFIPLTECFFRDDFSVDAGDQAKHMTAEAKKLLRNFAEKLKASPGFLAHDIEEICRKLAEEAGVKASALIHPTRVAISGITKGAGLFEMMEILGKNKVLERLEKAAT